MPNSYIKDVYVRCILCAGCILRNISTMKTLLLKLIKAQLLKKILIKSPIIILHVSDRHTWPKRGLKPPWNVPGIVLCFGFAYPFFLCKCFHLIHWITWVLFLFLTKLLKIRVITEFNNHQNATEDVSLDKINQTRR